ncbi:MAG: ACT domain-containing protein [Candidatus Micrarchaeota archaeon]|nr:ACT domain-containing protein [Candidatus Micrarchaeota archaeon]
MKSITVVSEDRVGLLADISYILGKANVNIEGLNVDVVGKQAVITLTIKDAIKASSLLEKNGFVTAEQNCIVVKLPNKPGAVSLLANRLASEKINIEDMHSLSADGEGGVFAINVDKPRKATKIIGDLMVTTNGPSIY